MLSPRRCPNCGSKVLRGNISYENNVLIHSLCKKSLFSDAYSFYDYDSQHTDSEDIETYIDSVYFKFADAVFKDKSYKNENKRSNFKDVARHYIDYREDFYFHLAIKSYKSKNYSVLSELYREYESKVSFIERINAIIFRKFYYDIQNRHILDFYSKMINIYRDLKTELATNHIKNLVINIMLTCLTEKAAHKELEVSILNLIFDLIHFGKYTSDILIQLNQYKNAQIKEEIIKLIINNWPTFVSKIYELTAFNTGVFGVFCDPKDVLKEMSNNIEDFKIKSSESTEVDVYISTEKYSSIVKFYGSMISTLIKENLVKKEPYIYNEIISKFIDFCTVDNVYNMTCGKTLATYIRTKYSKLKLNKSV